MEYLPSKNIIIKNMTGEDLKEIYLTYEGLEKHPLKIPHISKGGFQTRTLIVNHLVGSVKLRLFYYKNNNKEEIVVYDNLNRHDLRTLIFNISIKNGKLDVNTSLNS